MTYSPFTKPIAQLDESDIQKLVADSVREGFFVEFKETPPDKAKIAHGIAALANTYGGWFILGVKADRTNNAAIAAPGFEKTVWADPIATIRDVIKSHVDPLPLFTPHVVKMSPTHIAVVIEVPETLDGPYITSDGRLYRRAGDSSDPVYERDRYALDRLYDRTKRAQERFAEFCRDEREFAKGEDEQGWAQVFLSPHPYGSIDSRNILMESERIAKLRDLFSASWTLFEMGDANRVTGNIPFDTAYTTPYSVVLEQQKSLVFSGLSVEVFADGRARILLPLGYQKMRSRDLVHMSSPQARNALQTAITRANAEQDLPHLRFVNSSDLWFACGVVVKGYVAWLGEFGLPYALDMAVRLENVWRCVPYSDTDKWGAHVERFGLPLIRHERITFPRRDGVSWRLDLDGEGRCWMSIAAFLGQALGLPPDASVALLMDAIVEASKRSQSG